LNQGLRFAACVVKIFVKIKIKSKQVFVKKIDETHFEVAIKEPPIQGKANQAVIRVLADYFDVSPSRIRIVSGQTSRQKLIEIIS
jgi:uncharacterized protein (TIGR00251 family)